MVPITLTRPNRSKFLWRKKLSKITIFLYSFWIWTELDFEPKSSCSHLFLKYELVQVQVHKIWTSLWTFILSLTSSNTLIKLHCKKGRMGGEATRTFHSHLKALALQRDYFSNLGFPSKLQTSSVTILIPSSPHC